MKSHRFSSVSVHGRMRALTGALILCFAGASAHAATNIQLWASLNPHNTKLLENQVQQFNRGQSDVKVSLRSFDNPDQIESELAARAAQKKSPHLVQLRDNRAPETIAARGYIKPLHTLLAKHPIKDAKWFIAPENGFVRDAKGQLLAFPYMAEVPVMYYNIAAFQKAGISPAAPQRSWEGLQGQLVDLANRATRQCPATTDQPVSVNLENLAAVNNQFFTTNENGIKGKAAQAFTFDATYVRHLSLMISWVRTELLVGPALDGYATQRFANNECAVLLSGSGNLGSFSEIRALNFGVSGLPYYPQVTKEPGDPFPEGSAIWATAGHTADEDKATAQFLAWLAQPQQAAEWYQKTGYLPLTEQAFSATKDSYYRDLGDWKNLVLAYNEKPESTERGFRIHNYPKIRAMFHETLKRALSGQQPAAPALSSASAEASKLMNVK